MRFLVPLLLLASLLMPSAAFAADATFFGPIVPPECNCEPAGGISANGVTVTSSAADWGCILQTVQNGMNFAVSISIIIVLLTLVYAGIIFMTSVGNPESRSGGRKVVMNAFLGMLVVLCAWLLVDFIMKMLYHPEASTGSTELGPWNAILTAEGAPLCIAPTKAPATLPAVIGAKYPATSGGNLVPRERGGGSGGTCQAPSGPPCSVEALKKTCFANVADEAAQVCNMEGTNNPQNESRSDKTADGHAYSIGLFQINLTNSFSEKVNGRKCDEAFTEPCQEGAVVQSGKDAGKCRARVKDMALYNACVNAAKNASTNITVACRLYDGDWGRWSWTARKCNLPR